MRKDTSVPADGKVVAVPDGRPVVVQIVQQASPREICSQEDFALFGCRSKQQLLALLKAHNIRVTRHGALRMFSRLELVQAITAASTSRASRPRSAKEMTEAEVLARAGLRRRPSGCP